MSNTPNAGTTCPSCGTRSPGKFCIECGAALFGVTCSVCQTPLTPGAKFCHSCGAAAGASPQRVQPQPAVGGPATTATSAVQGRSIVPWVAAFVAMLAVVIAVAVQQRGAAPAATSANIPLDGSSAAPFAGGATGAMRAPDISSMSPRERADRLYDRVMRLASEGKTDSASFFANMAAQAYELLGPLDNDLRYDYGRMAEMSGNLDLARQQSEAILASNPDHLLGIILGARVAQLQKNEPRRRQLLNKLLAVERVELAKAVEEYERHKGDIEAALAEAK